MRIFFCFLCIICFCEIFAQYGNTAPTQQSDHTSSRPISDFTSNTTDQTDRGKKLKNPKADTPYYFKDIMKINGCLVGKGLPIREKDASRLNCCYKLYKKNKKAKHYYLVQAVDGFGRLTTNHGISLYLLDPFEDRDIGANKYWAKRLQSFCQVEFVESADGKEIVREKYLDEKGNLLLTAIVFKITANTYRYSYYDNWGRPAFLRINSNGEGSKCANFVDVTRDDLGREVLIRYIDEYGLPQVNSSGAFMRSICYDKDNNITKKMSLNSTEKPMMDNDGNCGNNYAYINDTIKTIMCYDSNWKRMTFPNKRGVALNDSVCGYFLKYDKYGREVLRGFYNTDSVRCNNKYGVFERICIYNEHGLDSLVIYKDQNGNIVASDKLGTAKIKKKYTNKGILTEKIVTYIINGQYNDISHYEYNCDSTNKSDTTIWAHDNLKKIRKLDKDGHEISISFFDLNGHPALHDGYHKKEMTRVHEKNDKTNQMTITTEWFGIDGEPAFETTTDLDGLTARKKDYSKSIEIIDSVSKKRTELYYDGNLFKRGKKIQSASKSTPKSSSHHTGGQQKLNSNEANHETEFNILENGELNLCRSFLTLYSFLCAKHSTNQGVETRSYINEFDEPAYATDRNIHFATIISSCSNTIMCDEFGNIITDAIDFDKSLPKVLCIKVTDTGKASRLGLKNGDVIVAYGDWTSPAELNNVYDRFYFETILKSEQAKTITLLRHDISSNEKRSLIVKVELPNGEPSDFGFEPLVIAYTQKEKQRFIDTCKENNIVLN